MPETRFLSNLPQLIAAIACTINAISDGMQYGWTAPVVPLLKADESNIKITDGDETWLETIYLFGSIASLPITIYLVDRAGRKLTIMLASITSLVAWTVIGIANSREYLYAGRFLAGLAGDVAFVAAPMYVAEIADQKIRGFLSSIIYLMMLLGILVIYSVAPYVPFYAPSIVAAAILLVQLLSMSFMPESPYFLLKKGKREAAVEALNWLKPTGNCEEELHEIARSLKIEESEKPRVRDILLLTNNRKALIIIVVVNGAQHFCGITVLMMNIHSILEEAGFLSLDSNLSAILFSVVMLVSATISSFTIDKYGRKTLLTLSSVLTGLCLLILAIFFNLKYTGVSVENVNWIPVVVVMFYAAVFKFGLGMVPIVLTAELFSPQVKALGMTVADAVYVSFASLSILFYQQLTLVYGMHFSFYVFASVALLVAVFSVVVVPETKGVSLDEIQQILKGEYTYNNTKQENANV